MTVPNYSHVPRRLYETGLFDLLTHDGQEAFTDAVVATLNGIDTNFRHLKKKPGQTNVHMHGEDSVLYLLPNNLALAVDFISGAGGPSPKPGWEVGVHEYTHADAHDPDDHGIGAAVAQPQQGQPYPDEPIWWGGVFTPAIIECYAAVQRIFPDPRDPGVTLDGFRHWSRTAYDIRDGMRKEFALEKRLVELRKELAR